MKVCYRYYYYYYFCIMSAALQLLLDLRFFFSWHLIHCKYTVPQKKNSQNCFCHNFVEFSLTLIIFGRRMANMMKLCNVLLFFTSLNLCQRTIV